MHDALNGKQIEVEQFSVSIAIQSVVRTISERDACVVLVSIATQRLAPHCR